MPTIVVVDGHAANPGDLPWDALEALGECTIYPRTSPEEMVARCRDAEIAITNKALFSAAVLAELPRLKFIGVTATGVNCVDLPAASARGVVVANVPAYSTDSVVQMVFGHLLNLTLRVGYHAHTVKHGRWASSPDFCYWHYPLVEIAGLTMGIIGFGRIGRAVARAAAAFGMKVLAYKPGGVGAVEGVRDATLEEVFRKSDVLSLHCPLTPQTAGLVDRARLALMKPTAYLINTSRGGVIDEEALAEALAAGRLAGAGLDVLSTEPPPADHPLVPLKNCHITPHIAWATKAARQRLLEVTAANVRAFLAGRPENVVT